MVRHGSGAQKELYLTKIATGELRLQSMAVTEPTSGSDTTKLKTTAVRSGDRYIVNGQKVWISRVRHSDLLLLLARTTPLAEVRKKSDGMAVVIVGGAISALEAREIVYGAIGLAFSFFGVAGLFFLLDAPFVAVFQITVYIGAVAVLILFTVMLVREGRWMRDSLGSLERLVGIFTAVVLAASLALAFAASHLLNSVEASTAPSFVGIGQFIVLAAAVLGAMMLAKEERKDNP